MGVLASSHVTSTTTVRFHAASPIATLEYVATLLEALTPAGSAVLVIETAIVYE
jgi:hypothetical protein